MSRSQAPRELTKTNVVRWARTWSRIAFSRCGQIEADTRAGTPAPGPSARPAAMARPSALSERQACEDPARPIPEGREPRPPPALAGAARARSIRVRRSEIAGMRAMFSTGTDTVTSGVARPSSEMIVTGCGPPRKRATSSGGETVADRPMRCAGRPRRSSRRSRDTARCVPRLEPAKEWISSTMTVSTVRSVSRTALVSMR